MVKHTKEHEVEMLQEELNRVNALISKHKKKVKENILFKRFIIKQMKIKKIYYGMEKL